MFGPIQGQPYNQTPFFSLALVLPLKLYFPVGVGEAILQSPGDISQILEIYLLVATHGEMLQVSASQRPEMLLNATVHKTPLKLSITEKAWPQQAVNCQPNISCKCQMSTTWRVTVNRAVGNTNKLSFALNGISDITATIYNLCFIRTYSFFFFWLIYLGKPGRVISWWDKEKS